MDNTSKLTSCNHAVLNNIIQHMLEPYLTQCFPFSLNLTARGTWTLSVKNFIGSLLHSVFWKLDSQGSLHQVEIFLGHFGTSVPMSIRACNWNKYNLRTNSLSTLLFATGLDVRLINTQHFCCSFGSGGSCHPEEMLHVPLTSFMSNGKFSFRIKNGM